MTPPRDLMGTLTHETVLRYPWRRRAIFAVLIVIFALLTLYPQRYHAAMTMTPTDPASLGLSSALGEFGAVNSVFGNQAAVEVVLKVGRSPNVRKMVIDKLGLVKRMGFANDHDADRWLEKAVELRSLRGGIIMIEAWRGDAAFARELVAALADSTRTRLADIGRQQTEYKRTILLKLIGEANKRLAVTQTAYDNFRLRTRYAQPANAIAVIGTRVAQLQEIIRSKEVQLNAARQFATDSNLSVRQLLAEISSLQQQLDKARALNSDQTDSVGDVVVKSTEVRELERQLTIARALHDNYERFLDGTAVEDLTQGAVVRVLEPPYIDSARQYNLLPMMLMVLLAGLALAMEFYLLRPPVGDGRVGA
ncbi:hypothetical protein [Sphingomonas sp. 28-63-12]|uniref:hypothetical protein n=1 Tax=Sphingomonas sp. 28-63-12 TaxID=1970434 RepID=UPI000BDAD646|nr:MAG: hypothetical protein B7Y47_10010 [Sphingomonas sp. 28-63-12]